MPNQMIICNTYDECRDFIRKKKTNNIVLLSDECNKVSNNCISIFNNMEYSEIRRIDWLAYKLLRMHDIYLKDFQEHRFYIYLKYIFDSIYSLYTPVSRLLRRILFMKKIIEKLQPSNIVLVDVPFLEIPWATIEKVGACVDAIFDPVTLLHYIISYYESLTLPEFTKLVRHRLNLSTADRSSAKPIFTPYLLQLWTELLLYTSSTNISSLTSKRLIRNLTFSLIYNLAPKYYMIKNDYEKFDTNNIDIAYVITFANSARTAYPLVEFLKDKFKVIGVATHVDGLLECLSRGMWCNSIGNYTSKVFTENMKKAIVSLAKNLYLYFSEKFVSSDKNKHMYLFEILGPALTFHSILAVPYGMALILGFKKFFESTHPKIAISFDDIGFAGLLFIYVAREYMIKTVTFQHSVIDDILRYKDTIADVMCVWGDYCENLLTTYGIPASKLVVVGSLRSIRAGKKISVNINRVLNKQLIIGWFPTKFIDADIHRYINRRELLCILNGINLFIDKHSDWNPLFIIKIHPQDERYFYERIVDELKNDLYIKLRNSIVITDIPIEKIIDYIDLVFVTNSTSSIEALLSGKVIGYVNCSDIDETLPLVKYGAGMPIKCPNDIASLLKVYTNTNELSILINRLEKGRMEFIKHYLNNGVLDYGKILQIINS